MNHIDAVELVSFDVIISQIMEESHKFAAECAKMRKLKKCTFVGAHVHAYVF